MQPAVSHTPQSGGGHAFHLQDVCPGAPGSGRACLSLSPVAALSLSSSAWTARSQAALRAAGGKKLCFLPPCFPLSGEGGQWVTPSFSCGLSCYSGAYPENVPSGEKCLSPGSVPVHQVWGEDAGGSPPSCRGRQCWRARQTSVPRLQGKMLPIWCEQLPGCCPRTPVLLLCLHSSRSVFLTQRGGLDCGSAEIAQGDGAGVVMTEVAAVGLRSPGLGRCRRRLPRGSQSSLRLPGPYTGLGVSHARFLIGHCYFILTFVSKCEMQLSVSTLERRIVGCRLWLASVS